MRLVTVLFAAFFFSCTSNRTPDKADKTEPSKTVTSKSKTTAKTPAETVRVVSKTTKAMGTIFACSVAVGNTDAAAGPDDELVRRAIDAAFSEVSRVERLMSVYIEDSVVSQINRAAGERPVSVPRELLDLIKESKRMSELTEGKFDISFGAVGKLWDFRSQNPSLPDPKALAEAVRLIDYKSIAVDEEAGEVMLKKRGMSIGLGAVAKGYGVDKASAVLRAKGFDNFIVDGGGDIYISGTKGGTPWRVGIQDPRHPEIYFADFGMDKGGAVVTSGDYERFFEINGKRYHHIIDPSTGYPAKGVVSSTIFADTAMKADALATGILILGIDKGMKLIEADPAVEGLLVDDQLVPHLSSGLRNKTVVRPITGAVSDRQTALEHPSSK